RRLHAGEIELLDQDRLEQAEQGGQVRGTAAGHHRVHGDAAHVGDAPGYRHLPDDLGGVTVDGAEHRLHAVRRRRDDRQAVAPATLIEEVVDSVAAARDLELLEFGG